VVDDTGQTHLLQSKQPAAGMQTVAFTGLEKGTYRVRVMVRDRAQNVTSEDIGVIVVEQGCQLHRGHAVPRWPALLVLIAALWAYACVRRRGVTCTD
jgi:hypothetical protein